MARNFVDSSNDDIDYTLTSAQACSGKIFSVGGWVNWDTVASYDRTMAKGGNGGGNPDWILEFDTGLGGANEGWVFHTRDWTTSDHGVWYADYATDNMWHHFLWTFDGTDSANNPSYYLDGSSNSVTRHSAPSGTWTNTQTDFRLGGDTGGFQYLDGKLAEIAMWNRELADSEAAMLAHGLSPLFIPNGLVFYTPLIGTQSPEPEIMAGSDGVLNGTDKETHPPIIYPTTEQIKHFTSAAAGIRAMRQLIGVGQGTRD